MDLKTLVKSIIPSQDVVVGGKNTTKSSGIPVDVNVRLDPAFGKTLLKGAAYIGTGIAVGMIGREAIRKLR